MHDIQGLIDLMGGESNFTAKLDSVFSVPNTVKVGTYGRMIHEMTEMMMMEGEMTPRVARMPPARPLYR